MKHRKDYIYSLISHLRQKGAVIFLESQKKDHPESSKSLLAAEPSAWIKSKGDTILIFENGVEREVQGNPWEELMAFKNSQNDWLFGYFGYDLKNSIEDLSSENNIKIHAPDMFFMCPGFLLEISKDGIFTQLKSSIAKEDFSEVLKEPFRFQKHSFIPKNHYFKKIEQAKYEITEGEFYEINLSHPIEFEYIGDSLHLFKKMKAAGPVPFAAFIALNDLDVCCASPERFLARKGGRVWSQPIKGTISNELQNDGEMIAKKLRSTKNEAENLMIVDLVRNDLNRIAQPGTVNVEYLFEVQSFHTVHHLVSTIACKVDDSMDSVEIIKKCFPMGSMTGAPKIAAMKGIESLEDYRRGIYSGAIGYIAPNGDFDFNVVIRTAVIKGERLIYPVGGAITSDSVPEEEWDETMVKARALTNLLHQF